jgi:GNAT superfamily N-acetyltransferase
MTETVGQSAGGEVTITAVALDHPLARTMEERLVAEMVTRYGGAGPGPVPLEHFTAPQGCFLVAHLDDVPVACAGFRFLRPSVAEVKRMYVDVAARGHGLARRLLAELEQRAAAAGYTQMWLETGTDQPEAVALYTSAGYRRMDPYGEYRYDPGSRCYYRTLDR